MAASQYDLIITQSPSGPTSNDTFVNKLLIETENGLYDEDVTDFVTTLVDKIVKCQRSDISVVRALITTAVKRGDKKGDDSTWRRFRFDDKPGERAVVNGKPSLRRVCALFEGSGEKLSSLLFLRGCYYHNETEAGTDGDVETTSAFVNTDLIALAAHLKTASNPEATVRIVAPPKKNKLITDVRHYRDWKYLGATEHDTEARKRSTEEILEDAGESLAQQLLEAIEQFVETHGAAIGPIGIWLAQPGSQANTLIGKIVAVGAGAAAIALVSSRLPLPLRAPVSAALSNVLL